MAAKRGNTRQTATKTDAKSSLKATAAKSTSAKTSGTTASGGSTRTKGSQIELTEIPPSLGNQVWQLLRRSVMGKILLVLVLFASIVGVDLLLALNNFRRFGIILGIEVILLAVILWIVYVVRNREEIFSSGDR